MDSQSDDESDSVREISCTIFLYYIWITFIQRFILNGFGKKNSEWIKFSSMKRENYSFFK